MMDISLIEEQLNDLLDVLGCPEKKSRSPPTRRCSEPAFTSLITPLERIVKTKQIWYLPDITREEAVKLLSNKKTGNFIIRGSRQPQTLALSVRLKDRQDFPPVQHFIIQLRERKVSLEDSDLVFDNIISLTFHYTQVCDELPETLTLPDVLATASSLQNLVSLSLLGKSFWSYPMARSGRMSVFLSDSSRDGDDEVPLTPAEQGRLTRTPPRPPNRTRAQPQPPARQGRARRNSDSVPFIISPARVGRPARHSTGDLQDSRQWVTSPVFSPSGRNSPPLPSARTRKVSVFYNKLGHVDEESDEGNDSNNNVRSEENDYADLPKENEEEGDYAFPLDAISEENDNSIYENPEERRQAGQSSGGIKCDDRSSLMTGGGVMDSRSQPDISDRVHSKEQDGEGGDGGDSFVSSPLPAGDKRKLSLGIILRKLSTGSTVAPQNKDRKSSLQERRLSSAITKLITLPIFERKTLGESYQVNSLSWEFLNKDADDECWDRSADKSKHLDDKNKIDVKMPLEKHPSMDSLYESEFDSSSTMESSVSSSSLVNKKVAPVSN